jgi:hypothetical protein
MKECPECKRTYPDETLAFCLVDGSILSAPFSPPQPTVASPRNEPPTELIPEHLLPKVKRSSGTKYVAVGLLCLLLGGGAVALIYSLGTSHKNQQDSPASSPSAASSPVTPANLSPTQSLRAYIEAASRRDVPDMKSHLSQGTLSLMEQGARNMNRNLDDMLKEEASQMPPNAANIIYSNERINGNTATVDMTAQGQTATMPLVKENGEWKLALDKFIQDMKNKSTGK